LIEEKASGTGRIAASIEEIQAIPLTGLMTFGYSRKHTDLVTWISFLSATRQRQTRFSKKEEKE
jgi:hypothetical protein